MQNQETTWLIFRTVMTGVLALAAFYVGNRLGSTTENSTVRWGIWLALLAFLVLQFIAPQSYRQHDPSVLSLRTQATLWLAFSALGFFGAILLVLAVLDFGWLFYHGYAQIREALGYAETAASLERRGFLASLIPLAAVGGAGVASTFGAVQARMTPRVREVEVPVEGLHPDLDGLRIAQISDLHVGQTINREFVEKVVETTLNAKPDLIALTGDFVDGFAPILREWTAPLGKLQAPLGVHYSPGNHEYYWGVEDWLTAFREMGHHVHHNAHALVTRGSARVLVTGLADHQAPRMGLPGPDIIQALNGAPEHDFHLLMTHQPKGYQEGDRAQATHPVHLQLSGHTHAGQFFPIAFIHPFLYRYWRGLNRHENRSWVYVCSGTGYWGPPNRFGVPSEIALLKLKKV